MTEDIKFYHTEALELDQASFCDAAVDKSTIM
jgi:hypothetical protein